MTARSLGSCPKVSKLAHTSTSELPTPVSYFHITTMTRTEVHWTQYLAARSAMPQPGALDGVELAELRHQHTENNQATGQGPSSLSSGDARPVSPPPVYRHRYSPSNRSLFERPLSFNSAPSIASVPRSVASLPPYVASPPPPIYRSYNPSNNATAPPPPAVRAVVPAAPRRNHNEFRLTYIQPWRRPDLVGVTLLIFATSIGAVVFFLWYLEA